MQGIITPDIFKGHAVSGFFTSKSFHADFNEIKARLNADAVFVPIQKHTDKVLVVESDLEPKIADAVVTDRKGLIIGVQVADCVPILLFDTKRLVIGAVHAGWRGTAEGILKNTIAAFRERFCSLPENILIAIGPSIKSCCYVVGHEVIEGVTKATGKGDYVVTRGEKIYIDLPSANMLQAISEGVTPQNISISSDCTHCLPEKYYSYRFAKGTTGRQYGFIMIPK